jgi:hypothetical protein
MTGNQFLIVTLVGFLGALTLAGWLGIRAYYRLWRKGYRSPATAVIVAAPPLIAMLVGFLAMGLNPAMEGTDATWDPALAGKGLLLFALGSMAPLLVVALGLEVASRLKRPRSIRTGGRRKVSFPWRLAGWTQFALGLLIEFSGPASATSARSKLAGLLLAGGAYCLYLARRSRAPSLEEVRSHDERPPVLFIRPFNREEEIFAELSLTEMREYSSHVTTQVGATLEQYLRNELSRQLGPFVALGSPEDYIPPEGAARDYAEDRDWRARFEQLAADAACLLMEVAESENLRWELQYLRETGLCRKLFVVTPPRARTGLRNLRIRVGVALLRWVARLKGLPRASWSGFATTLGALGYVVDPDDPGPGTVVCFDGVGRATVAFRNAATARDYVGVINSALDVRGRT